MFPESLRVIYGKCAIKLGSIVPISRYNKKPKMENTQNELDSLKAKVSTNRAHEPQKDQ